jgi:hypothetical protein
MTKIFISYRRADSQDFTDRLFEYMGKHFGDHNVFQDVGDSTKIPLGVDFVEYIAEQISQCDIILVVIGEQWLRILQERENRFDDFVRIEVESALKQNKVVIPILKSGANIPTLSKIARIWRMASVLLSAVCLLAHRRWVICLPKCHHPLKVNA